MSIICIILDMDFFKNKIKKFQEKKLDEILFKIQFHESTKKKLEEQVQNTDFHYLSKFLSFENDMRYPLKFCHHENLYSVPVLLISF